MSGPSLIPSNTLVTNFNASRVVIAGTHAEVRCWIPNSWAAHMRRCIHRQSFELGARANDPCLNGYATVRRRLILLRGCDDASYEEARWSDEWYKKTKRSEQ